MKITIIFALLLFILLLILVGFYVIWVIDAIKIKVPYVNTKRRAIKLIVKEFDLKDDDVLYDLGSGSGDLLVQASINNPKIKAYGYELGRVPFLISKFNTSGFKNITLKRENLFNADIENATKIYCYLGTSMMKKLEPYVLNKCKKGTLIYSTDFKFPTLKHIKEIDLSKDGRLSKKLYVYKV